MRFGLCVRLGVDLHVRLTEEGRRTHPAPTGVETEMEGRDGSTRRRKKREMYKRRRKKKREDGTEED